MSSIPEFSKRDLEDIELFRGRVKELQNTKIVRGGTKLSFDFYDDLSLAQKQKHLQKEEIIRSFILSFRHFYLDGEQVHFNRFHNKIIPKVSDPEAREVLKDLRKRYKHVLNNSGSLVYYYKGQKVTPKTMIDLWFNGHYFHSDPVKRDELNEWLNRSGGIFQFLFLDALKELAAILICYSKILGLIVGRRSRRPCT